MSTSKHTYGPTCHLSHVVTTSSSKGDDDIPPLKVQFFYSSPLPIDDPLTTVPTPSGSESRPTKHAPRPFSAYDNNALEEAWLGLSSDQDRKNHRKLKNSSLRPLTQKEPASKQSKDKTKDAMNKKSAENNASSAPKTGCTACPIPNGRPENQSGSLTKVSKSANNITETVADLHSGNLNSQGPSPSTFVPTTEISKKNTKTVATKIPKGPRDAEAVNTNTTETAHGNTFNTNPEDPQYFPMDVGLYPCCSDLERDARADQQEDIARSLETEESTGWLPQDSLAEVDKQKGKGAVKAENWHTGTAETMRKQKERPGHCDGADDGSQLSVDDDEASFESSPARDLEGSNLKESKSKEQKSFEKNKQSKDHNLFKDHLKADLAMQSKPQTAGAGSNKNKLIIPGTSETGTTGFPFQRAPSRRANLSSRSRSPSLSVRGDMGKGKEADDLPVSDMEPSNVQSSDATDTINVHHCKVRKNIHNDASVPVGISRLHLVKLPDLLMMPIYWSPVHDIAAVIRGTWFYKDTMCPVEPAVANQLEIGYRELRPWSQTWRDELCSALEVGAAGEEKISHRIWPRGTDQTGGNTGKDQILTAADPFCAARCFHGEVAAAGSIEIGDNGGKNTGPTQITKRFPNSQVIYKDAQNAFILKPSLQPSEYYGRRPFAKINKGKTIGIQVIRGFDWKAWEKLHDSKKSSNAVMAEEGAPVAGDAAAGKRAVCAACLEQEKRPKVTDLILVIHGIGQKLSERVESFHFTHAINSFRRCVNVELCTDAVQKVLRDDLGGVMVLPVNWRSNLSFEDGGPMKKGDMRNDNAIAEYTLKDITPDTIPAVRNLVSDVMLDIPFYMSIHKPKMIEALICEANRVYRLWCQNNPEFRTEGRVHIIAHSLGSAMALDVLSKQPTSVNPVDLRSKTSSSFFEFDTKNLFFVGSPAGFFLLLNRSHLIPRRGRNKPDTEPGDDRGKEIAGEAGTFGCLAVDNLYNVMHCNDPVAYRLNATVDPLYAATLKNAQVPSATTGWMEAIGNAMRSITPGVSKTPELGVGQIVKPLVARLPSQLEMEVHDFTREEIAEGKMCLLNDNGQIDYFLSSGGGPLEIQYFNMLSAHSSYWGSSDFTRMVVTEVGREPGRSHCLPNMRVVKASHKQSGRTT
jgi:hypothetical protein